MSHQASMEDVQGSRDHRHLAIDRVGIQGLRLPISIQLGPHTQPTVATCSLSVHLPEERKGTHMSRMAALLHEQRQLSLASLPDLLRITCERLDSTQAEINLRFAYFIEKTAPVSGAVSLMDYDVQLKGVIDPTGIHTWLTVVVPVTSLCPCSKQISAYGAHNQRSHITLTVEPAAAIDVGQLIALAEAEASAELYAILKRPDEKAMTERAYDNPKFVEDLTRDVAKRLDAMADIIAFTVTVENFESIHNHSAIASLSHRRRPMP